ncbi:flagellar hook-associated protein FlgL [Demequina zhanjiangensis]|uniref:Flagellar hook-associated protein FlgL n=1 Tax=Demequina zhanjiangensis TaxID=3051659 RepID=A0ABT8FZS3_9MICO|nr:flagellar hook-associated protein FlgL [Demequina sp. SYSU T00b26]MDN4472388.1 flagellar hook-associated protein FlgL [Demequina sp. SYSU T00b26]
MINRVTQQTVQRTTLANLQSNLAKMAQMQGEMSSGKLITKASDDPNAAGRSMTLRAEKSATTQALRNAQDGQSWLAQIDTTLQQSITSLQRARDLTVQGASTGSASATSREAIAVELEGLRDGLLDLANTTLNGRSLFAGTSSDGIAFDDGAGGYAWHGVAGASVERRIGADATVRVDADGAAAFGVGATSVFQLLDDIAADLRGGVDVTGRLDEIDARLAGMTSSIADVGIRFKQVMDTQSSLELKVQDLTSGISGLEDIDLAETVMELQMQEVAYQGALGAAGRVLQPTLMDFLS